MAESTVFSAWTPLDMFTTPGSESITYKQSGNDNLNVSPKIYPNPSSQLNIDFQGIQAHSILIYNLRGELLLRTNIDNRGFSSTIDIDTGILARGVYLVEIHSDIGVWHDKWIKL